MKRRGRPPDQTHLDFDLPLRPDPAGEEAPEEREPSAPTAAELPLFPESGDHREHGPGLSSDSDGKHGDQGEEGGTTEPEEELEEEVPFGVRLLGALADLTVHGGVLILAILGQSVLGVAPTKAQAPAYVLFLLAFSFLYCVVPMAFWGQTPGMASLGLLVRNPDGENLTFPQTALRWFAAVITCLLLGLPLLIALSGRSLGDRWSRSRTYRYRS